ncbi:tubby like protein 1 [Striga asiatica]|uniref:Tubby like protein 1 n=1 Tax=Striga asiatica TaxID=4170 RepID=A0A5A7Q2L1_STRAF|nr:tubby like protein 1 [Striga asiatica]
MLVTYKSDSTIRFKLAPLPGIPVQILGLFCYGCLKGGSGCPSPWLSPPTQTREEQKPLRRATRTKNSGTWLEGEIRHIASFAHSSQLQPIRHQNKRNSELRPQGEEGERSHSTEKGDGWKSKAISASDASSSIPNSLSRTRALSSLAGRSLPSGTRNSNKQGEGTKKDRGLTRQTQHPGTRTTTIEKEWASLSPETRKDRLNRTATSEAKSHIILEQGLVNA